MSSLARTDAAPKVDLWVSPTIEADYRNRGALPGLRADQGQKLGTWFVFRVPTAFAHQVLEDALRRKKELGPGRGVYQAYRSLVEKLNRALDEAEGVRPDPGGDVWEESIRALACLPVNTTVMDEDGQALKITRPYGRYHVNSTDGVFRDKDDGQRFSYQYGYVCKEVTGGPEFFRSAGKLYDEDGEITHLRLAHSR